MNDNYNIWAEEVCVRLRQMEATCGQAEFVAVIAAGLRGSAIEALEHAETVIAKAAKKELHKDRKAGVAGARMVIRALSMAIKNPLPGDVKPVGNA